MSRDNEDGTKESSVIVQGKANTKPTGIEAYGAVGAAAVTGVAGYAATSYAMKSKLLPFDTKVAEKTVEEIKKMGLTGGLIGSAGAATDGAQFAGGAIKEKIYLNMLNESKLARFTHNIGGRGVVSTIGALITGLIGFGIGMAMLGGRKKSSGYDFEKAKREALNRASDYSSGLPGEALPTQKSIDLTAKYDPRKADILQASRELAASEGDSVKQQEILNKWQAKLADKETVPASSPVAGK